MPPKEVRAKGLQGADAPMNQSRAAHLAARRHHYPEGAMRHRDVMSARSIRTSKCGAF
jgi:hypothetical protein